MYSYDEILSKMVQKYEELSGFSLSNESDIMLRLKVLSSELFNSYSALEFVKRQMFVPTAEAAFLDKHALERGLSRKSGVKARGEVTFSLSSVITSDIVINKGTVVSTQGPDVKTFETTQAVVLKAGRLSVKVPVLATKEGADHNVTKGAVCVMVTPPLYINQVTNELAFTSGADSEKDEQLRQRIIESYKDISNGTNEVYYKRLAQSVDGVYSASVKSGVRGIGTINIYIGGKGEKQITKEHINAVQKLVDENRELNVDALVVYANERKVFITMTLEVIEGYDFEKVSNEIKEKIIDYVDSLSVAQPFYLCDVGEIIYHTEGVKNYNFLQPYTGDVYPEINEYCAVEMIEIRSGDDG